MSSIYFSGFDKLISDNFNQIIGIDPDAYKPIDKILPLLSETVNVIRTFKPLYNFKAKN